jgi:PIN domain nuclease of toxin-antitoxin system
MTVTADTHIIIWRALNPGRISNRAGQCLDEAEYSGGVIMCDITFWEIAMLMEKERLKIDIPYLEFIDLVLASGNYSVQPITPEIADTSTRLLREINADPADRLIAAASIILKAPLVTADKNLRSSQMIETIW